MKNYLSGVFVNINFDEYFILVDMFEDIFKKFSCWVVFLCMGKELFFVEIDKYFKVFGVYLYFCGLEFGDKIVFMMFNFL